MHLNAYRYFYYHTHSVDVCFSPVYIHKAGRVNSRSVNHAHGGLHTAGLTDFPTSSVFCLDVGFPMCSDWNYMSSSRHVDTTYLNYRLFVPKTFRSQERKVRMENFRFRSREGPFVPGTFRSPGNFRSRALSFSGTFVPGERKFLGTFVPGTFHSWDLSCPGTFVPIFVCAGLFFFAFHTWFHVKIKH